MGGFVGPGCKRVFTEVDAAGVRFSAPWLRRQREYETIPWASVRLWRTSALVQLDLRLGLGRKAQIEIGYASAECNRQLSVVASAKVAAAATMVARHLSITTGSRTTCSHRPGARPPLREAGATR
jgi:hypothetical protein